MCNMCIREMEAAKGHLSDLICEYRSARAEADRQDIDASDLEHCAGLAHRINEGVSEHYGVVNGQIAAVAIHQIVVGTAEFELVANDERITLAVIAANEALKDKGFQTISTDAAQAFLTELAKLQAT